jgi:SAM-dependent methyltransferase
MAHASIDKPSHWVVRWAPLVSRGPLLDVAAGGGRHSRFFLQRNVEVVAVDREALDLPGGSFVKADIESGAWPFPGRTFGAIVVTNYLHRPLFPVLAQSLAPGGVLIYETFMRGNARYGRPSNPAFLLEPGELLQAFAALTTVAFEQGDTGAAVVQRLCAVRGEASGVRIAA